MKYISVCSGIEAASVAWEPLGWKAVAFSEIERFPCRVLAHHYPNTPNLGDMTRHAEWNIEPGSIDLLVGGTPCQSFSVAGLRAGMADPRGNLALVYLALAGRLRPRWVVWENVPGVLSSAGGRDFGSFLGGLGQLGYGWAYRVLDAQHFGVPQRRRRVFVVGCLGDWRGAAAVLFERASLRGDPSPGAEARERIAAGTLSRALSRVGGGDDPGANKGAAIVAHGLNARATGRFDASVETLVPIDMRQASRGEKLTNFRATGSGGAPGHGVGEVGDPAFTVSERGQAIAFSCKDHGADAGEVAPTLRSMGHNASHANGGGQAVLESLSLQGYHAEHGGTQETDASPELRALRQEVGAQAFAEWGSRILDSLRTPEVLRKAVHGCGIRRAAREAGLWMDDGPLSRQEGMSSRSMHALWSDGPDGRSPQGRRLAQQLAVELGAPLPKLPPVGASRSGVRRLTPVEAERLQGFPDDWTAIPGASDGARYKALGNSMAVPCMAWIGRRIAEVEALEIPTHPLATPLPRH